MVERNVALFQKKDNKLWFSLSVGDEQDMVERVKGVLSMNSTKETKFSRIYNGVANLERERKIINEQLGC